MEAEPGGDPPDRLLAEQSIERLTSTLSAETPELARATAGWMRSLSSAEPADYFTHPEAFPMLLLPWWMEESIIGSADPEFQAEIAYSSVCGYYFVRVLDDLMDGDNPPPAPVLPAMIVFHTEFQQAYGRLFPADHPFWDSFRRTPSTRPRPPRPTRRSTLLISISSRASAHARSPVRRSRSPPLGTNTGASICSSGGQRWSTSSAAGTRSQRRAGLGRGPSARPRDVFPVRSGPAISERRVSAAMDGARRSGLG